MADDGSAQIQTVWPRPRFHCQVQWDDKRDDKKIAFQEPSGLDAEAEVAVESIGIAHGGLIVENS